MVKAYTMRSNIYILPSFEMLGDKFFDSENNTGILHGIPFFYYWLAFGEQNGRKSLEGNTRAILAQSRRIEKN